MRLSSFSPSLLVSGTLTGVLVRFGVYNYNLITHAITNVMTAMTPSDAPHALIFFCSMYGRLHAGVMCYVHHPQACRMLNTL